MKILAIDDIKPALKLLTASIADVCPSAEIFPFVKTSELLAFAKDNPCDIAFLDIEMGNMSGLALAKELKDQNPKINIIFVTAHSQYASKAFELHPSGYVLKPATPEAVENEIKNLRHPLIQKNNAPLYVQTFGNFEVFSYGVPLKFRYHKAKELFAYLIDNNGAGVTANEICAALWENKPDTENLKTYVRKLISELTRKLKELGAEDVLIRQYKNIAVAPDKIICDSYGFMKGDPACVNAYKGKYMSQYSWAETPNWKYITPE